MPEANRKMSLTPELVARVHRVVEDTGPEPDRMYHNEDDYDAVVKDLMASHAGDALWAHARASGLGRPS